MKRKIVLRLSTMIASLSLLWSCQHELLQTEQDYALQAQQSTIQQLLRAQLEKKDAQLVSKIDRLQVKKPVGNAKIYTDAENSFSVDTEKAILVEDANGNKTYTFKIERNNANSSFLENLVLKQIGTSEYMAYISKYDQMAIENMGSIAQNELKNHITFTPLGIKTGGEIFGKYDANSACNVVMPVASNWVLVGGTMCYTGEHDFAHISECNYASNINGYPPTAGYYTYEISYGAMNICGGGGGSAGVGTMPVGGTTPIGGGGGGSTSTNDCEKVKKPFTDIPILRAKTMELAEKTSKPDEYAITITKNPDPANPVYEVPLGAPGAINIPLNPTDIYTFVAHSHNSPATSTYSVPGWGDLEWIFGAYQLYHKVDSNTVFIVITADGTRYALTISNLESFLKIFYLPKDTTPEELQKGEISNNIAKKYYGENVFGDTTENSGLIKENNTDNEKDLVNFLKMVKENNMGINMFELNSDYTQFTRVTLNNNTQVDRKPCN